MYSNRNKFKSQNYIFLLASILVHLFLVLCLSDLFGKKTPLDEFELNAIKVTNLANAAKNKASAKASKKGSASKKSGKRVAKKSKARPSKQAKASPMKKTALAKISPSRQPKNISKRVEFKAVKRAVKLEETLRRRERTTEREPITKKQLLAKLNKPKAETFKKVTTSIEQVTKMRTMARQKTPQIQTKVWRQEAIPKEVDKQIKPVKPTLQRQVVPKQQMQYQPRNNSQPLKLTQNRVVYKQQAQNPDRRPMEQPTQLTVSEPLAVQQRVAKVSSLKKVVKKTELKTRQLQIQSWRQETAPKEVDKQLKPVKSTLQRQVVPKQQMQYQFRDNSQPLKLTQNRVVYKQHTQNPDRQPMEQPTQLEINEPVKQVETFRYVTKYRQVIKKTVVTTRVKKVSVLKDELALEDVPLKNSVEKENQRVTVTSQRKVTLKQLEYTKSVDSAEPIKISQTRVIYEEGAIQQNKAEQNKKIINAPEIPTDLMPTETEAARVNLANMAKQAFDNPATEASSASLSFTQLSATIPAGSQDKAQKTTTFTSEQLRTNTMAQHKVSIQRTGDTQAQLVAFGDSKKTHSNSFSNPLADISNNSTGGSGVEIEVDLPAGSSTGQQLYLLTGNTDADVKTAFLTVNGTTQLVNVVGGSFVAEVALANGTNGLSITAFNGQGKMGVKSFQLIFTPPKGGIPVIRLQSPKNGRQGVKQGEAIIVEGTINDPSITKATLLLNRTPIPLEVKNGHFQKRINLPAGTIFLFRVMAQNQNGVRGFSPAHTVLAGSDIDILNPRPY
jgi:hypothetical protein